MRAMLLDVPGLPLRLADVPPASLGPHDVRLQISACGVCRTDLHVAAGEIPAGHLPLVLGHEIVGTVIERGDAVDRVPLGGRVGVPWLGGTCGRCRFCRTGRENLCGTARFTGRDRDGGYAEETVADARFVFDIPDRFESADAAPLLCAGLIGFRALSMTGDARTLGLYGFGAAAHIVCQIARAEGREVYAFTRPGDDTGQQFARSLGAVWAGGSDLAPPTALEAAIIFAPVGTLVPLALGSVDRGGVVVCAGIHMSAIPAFPYELLWGERVLRSVANLTRADGDAFFDRVARVPLRTAIERFSLDQANEALGRLQAGAITGAAVLVPQQPPGR